mgnify:CR=1 FL=1
MLKENEYVRHLPDHLNEQEKFRLRMQYRNMSKKEKKSMSSHITKFKQRLTPSQWQNYVQGRVEEGHKIHEQNKNNIYRDESLIRKSDNKKY